jgi:hypothetical protein
LQEDHAVHCRANEAYEAYRARGVMKDGRRFGKPPTPYQPPATPQGKVNLTDPDSRNVKAPRGHMQGYNGQGVCNEYQIRDHERSPHARDSGKLPLRPAQAHARAAAKRGGRTPAPRGRPLGAKMLVSSKRSISSGPLWLVVVASAVGASVPTPPPVGKGVSGGT